MASLTIWLYLLQLLQLVSCVPIVSFPFNAQLPPAARIGRLYSYSFPSYTFRSDTNITYQLRNGPGWLSLDEKNHRLFGLPTQNDVPASQGQVIGQMFQIVATDATGSVSMDGTIVVSDANAPEIKIPVSEQIKRFGSYSAPSSILSSPSTDFSFAFDPQTFTHPTSGINYYASTANNSPLPAWIKFDPSTLSFSGRTPAMEGPDQAPQIVDIQLVASDIAGFSATAIDFSIVVGSHKLTAESPVVTLNASRGASFIYDKLAGSIQLDNKPASSKDLVTSVAGLPGWLKFDPRTWVIKGMPKKDDRSANFTVKFTDPFSDTLEVLVKVNVATGLFKETLDKIEVTPGEHFSLDLAPYLRDAADAELKIASKSGQDWIKLNGLKMEGNVPSSATKSVEIRIEAASRSSDMRETEGFRMSFRPADGSAKPLPSATVTTSNDEPTGAGAEKEDEKDESEPRGGGLGKTGILLATVIPIAAVAFLVMLVVYLMRRRRIKQSKASRKDFRDKISRPVLGSLRVTDSGDCGGSYGDHTHAVSGDPASRAEKGGVVHNGSPGSSQSSNTLGSLSSSSRVLATQNAGYEPLRDVSSTTDDQRSWFTVERMPTGTRSRASLRSKQSGTTGPMSTHQLLPTPPFLTYAGDGAFSHDLEFTLPCLSELPHLQLDSETNSHPQNSRSLAMYSTITSSSAALPSSRLNSPEVGAGFTANVASAAAAAAGPPPPVPARSPARTVSAGSSIRRSVRKSRTSSDRDWTTIGDADGETIPDIPDMPLPPQAAMTNNPSHQRLSRPATADSAVVRSGLPNVTKSFVTEPSFGSIENWRVIGRYDRNAPDHLETPRQLGHRRSSPAMNIPPVPTAGAAAGASAAAGLGASPQGEQHLSNPRPRTSNGRYSKLNEYEQKAKGAWPMLKNDTPTKESRGSFAAFI